MQRDPEGISAVLVVGLLVIGVSATAASPVVAIATDSSAVVHLALEKSSPAEGAELREPPAEIRLWFTERPEASVSRISLEGPDGRVELGEVQAVDGDNAIVAEVLTALAPATYEVAWLTASGDGHPIRGTFEFSVVTAD